MGRSSAKKSGIKKGMNLAKFMGSARSRSWFVAKTIPQAIQTKLTLYPDQDEMLADASTSTVGYIETVYRMNSLYDPTASGSGTPQPVAYDQWKAMYFRYSVKTCSYTFKVYDLDSASPIVVGAYVTKNGTAVLTKSMSMETIWNTLSNRTMRSSARIISFDGQGKGAATIKGSVNIRGAAKESTVEDLAANVDSDPTDLVYLHTFVVVPGNAALTAQVYTRLAFDCVFFDRKILTDA